MGLVYLTSLVGCAGISSSPARRPSYQEKKTESVRAINANLKKNITSFRACYVMAKRQGLPNIRGQVTLVFTVAKDGRPQRAGLMESDLPMKMKACLIRVLWSVSFPPPATGRPLKVHQPLRF